MTSDISAVRRTRLRAAISCAVGMSLVGSSIAVAPAVAGYPVLAGQAWRYLLAALILLAVLGFQVAPMVRIRPANAFRLAGVAATGMAAFNWLLIEGTRHADPAFMAAVLGATPLVLALVGPVAGGDRIKPQTVAGSVVVVIGIVLIHGATAAPAAALPYALGFLACEVAFTMLAVPVLRELSPLQLSTGACLLAVPMLGAASLLAGEPSGRLPTATEGAALLYMAIFTTAIAFLLWYTGVAALGADRAGLFCGLMPVSGYLVGLLTGHSDWAVAALTGALLCGAGIAIGLLPSPPELPSPDRGAPRGGTARPVDARRFR